MRKKTMRKKKKFTELSRLTRYARIRKRQRKESREKELLEIYKRMKELQKGERDKESDNQLTAVRDYKQMMTTSKPRQNMTLRRERVGNEEQKLCLTKIENEIPEYDVQHFREQVEDEGCSDVDEVDPLADEDRPPENLISVVKVKDEPQNVTISIGTSNGTLCCQEKYLSSSENNSCSTYMYHQALQHSEALQCAQGEDVTIKEEIEEEQYG